MEIDEIKAAIKNELEALAGNTLEDLDEDIFFKGSFIDSMNMVNFVVFLEQKFGIKIEAFFTDREAVCSVSKLAEYIKDQLSQAESAR